MTKQLNDQPLLLDAKSSKEYREFLAQQKENQRNKVTLRKLKKLQLSVISTLQSVLNGDDIEAKVIQACSAATQLLRQNKVTVDPVLLDAGDPTEQLVEDVEMLPSRANR